MRRYSKNRNAPNTQKIMSGYCMLYSLENLRRSETPWKFFSGSAGRLPGMSLRQRVTVTYILMLSL